MEQVAEGFESSDLLDIEARVRLNPGQGREYDVSGVGQMGLGLSLDIVREWEHDFDALRMRLVTHYAVVSNPNAPADVRCHWLRS